MPKELKSQFCRVYIPSIPLHLVNSIRNIQAEAVKLEFAERKKQADVVWMKKNRKSKKFNDSEKWRALRVKAIELYGRKCHKCGSEKDIQVDHIKPKSKYPEIAFDIDNLQILCWPCNKTKSFRDETDYRETAPRNHQLSGYADSNADLFKA